MQIYAYDYNFINFGTRKQFKRSFKTCAYCGCEFTPQNRKTIDHLDARVNGGGNEITNKIVVCEICNRDKSDMGIKPYIDRHPYVEEYIRQSVNEHAGQIYDGIDWSEGFKEHLTSELGRDIFA